MGSKEELDRCTDEQLDKLIDTLGIVHSGNRLSRDDKVTMIIANANEENIKKLLKDICCKE
jgi:hypothetical protein